MLKYGFTGRAEGDMRDNIRLIKFIKDMRPGVKAVARPRQVHRDHIEVIDASVKTDDMIQSYAESDGLITRAKNVALTVLTADCVPITFSDEKTGTIGISHQGWKGCLARLPQKMIIKMEDLGSRAPDIKVSIGPSINACCYEIKQDRALLFRNEFPQTKAIVDQGNHFFLNLTQLAVEQLVESGVPASNIGHSITCTSCREDMYFSYRKAADKTTFDEQVSYIVQF